MENLANEIRTVITGELTVGNQTSLSVFANEPQTKLRMVSKTLSEIAMASTADIELTINQILHEIDNVNNSPPARNQRSISLFGGGDRDNLVKKYRSLLNQINEMTVALQLQQATLIKENARLRNLEPILEECRISLEEHIKHASTLSEQLRYGNPNGEGALPADSELCGWQARLDRKIEDLRLSHAVSIQNIAQVKLLQESNQQMIDGITAAITNAIPIWRTQIVLTLNIDRMKSEVSVQEKFAKTINGAITKTRKDLNRRTKNNSIDYEKLRAVNRELGDALFALSGVEREDSKVKRDLRSQRI